MTSPTCEMIVGYLVPHQCPNPAVSTCQKCGRQFCDEHLSIEQGGLICTACQQGLDQPIAVAATARTFTAEDLATFKSTDIFDDDYDEGDVFSDLS